MLVWVASYPRSGNHLTMQTLFDVFGVNTIGSFTHSGVLFRTMTRSNPYDLTDDLVGLSNEQLLEAFRDHPDTFFVKSHARRHSRDPAPGLYIVRDGRDVHVSMAHWTHDRKLGPYHDLPFDEQLERLIKRRAWSRHLEAWRTRPAPTGVIRFEDMLTDPGAAVKGAAEQAGLSLPEPVGEPKPFEDLHARRPTVYRKGKSGGWRDEMPPPLQRRFWRRHGHEMEAYGYERPADAPPPRKAPETGGTRKAPAKPPDVSVVEELRSLDKATLRVMAKELGQPVGGTKQELIARIHSANGQGET